MKIKFFTLILPFLLYLPPAWGQTNNVLLLSEAIELGLQNSHDIKIIQSKIKEAELQLGISWSSILPQLTVQSNYGRQDPIVKSNSSLLGGLGSNPQFAAMLGSSSTNNFRTTIALNQVLFSGFKILDNIKISNISLSLAYETLRQVKQEIAFQIVNAYFNALKAYHLVKIDKEALNQAENYLEVAKVKFKAGTGIKLDILKAQSQVINIQQTLSKDINNLKKAEMSLNLLLGREVDIPVELNLDAIIPDLKLEQDFSKCLEIALKNRPDIKQLELKKEINEISASIQSRVNWPTVALGISYNIQDNQVVDGNISNTQNINYGINLNWTLFDGLASSKNSEKFKESINQTQIQLEQLKQKVALEIKQSLLDILEAKERAIMAQEGLEVAKENVRIAEASYKEGVGISLNVIDAHVNLLQAKTSYIIAQYDLNISKAKLYKSLGLDIF